MIDADRTEESEEWVPDPRSVPPRWSRRAQRIASVLWPSFMVAAFSSLLFFSLVDAQLLGLAMMPEREFSAMTGYGATFFFFWFVALLSSGTTVYLRRTRSNRSNDDEERRG